MEGDAGDEEKGIPGFSLQADFKGLAARLFA